jgi:hypothetical protein
MQNGKIKQLRMKRKRENIYIIVYLKTLITNQIIGLIKKNQLEGMWKETIVAYFEVL